MAKKVHARPVSTLANRMVPIAAITPHPDNYNQHPESQLRQLEASYAQLGQYNSIVVWARPGGQYTQVARHGFLLSAKQKGATEIRADILPEDTDPLLIKRIMAADNLHARNSEPDEVLLARLLQEQADAGFDLTALGTDAETLRQMLESLGDDLLLDHTANSTGSGSSLYRDADEDIDAGFNGEAKLRFEAGRAGGAFAVHDLRTWDDARIARFTAWKDAPDLQTAECEHMAHEVAGCIRTLFGGILPPLVLTVPPRGQSAGSTTPYAAGVLAARVGALLGVDLVECLARAEVDTTADKGRARYTNLRDTSSFVATRGPDVLTVVLDDVTTTGNTLARARSTLATQHTPTLLLAYVVWHTRLEAPNHA